MCSFGPRYSPAFKGRAVKVSFGESMGKVYCFGRYSVVETIQIKLVGSSMNWPTSREFFFERTEIWRCCGQIHPVFALPVYGNCRFDVKYIKTLLLWAKQCLHVCRVEALWKAILHYRTNCLFILLKSFTGAQRDGICVGDYSFGSLSISPTFQFSFCKFSNPN